MTVAANATVRTTEKCWEHCVGRRFESAAGLMDADFVHDDRRRGLTNTITGRDGTIENNRVIVELGFTPEFETLLVSDDDLALVRATFRDAKGNEVVSLQVLGTNGQGLRTCCVSFDPDDLAPATSEFDRRRPSAA